MTGFRIGMPTLIELAGLDENVRLAQQLGLRFIELNMNLPEYLPDRLAATRLRDVSCQTGIEFTLHLPEELDLGASQPAIRSGHLACASGAIKWAGEAGIRLVNLHWHSGVYFSLPDRRVWLCEKYKDCFLERLADSFDAALRAARTGGVTVCIENAEAFGLPWVAEALDRLLALDGEHLGLTWDIGHDAADDWSGRPIFQRHQGRIRHMHVHDWDGTRNHQVLFTGSADCEAMILLARRLDVGVVIEVKTAESLAESVRLLDKRGLR